ncbi:glycoside hydrolase family 76 protein [Hamadaea tsunoensis]|uniref:glycoside hydrolase family 76 protein n=1 Tax=Hamadaea tsunoensis TaxID=53368 RepID=UPI000481089D|nr:glycosyl hydrolase [Hamadaea tsunoensis]
MSFVAPEAVMPYVTRALASLLLLAALVPALPAPAAAAEPVVCSVFCDRRDPSQARAETFPVPAKVVNGRQIRLHLSDPDGMAWASIDAGQTGDAVWLDRSFDGGATWDGLLGQASIPSGWTGTRTLLYNVADPSHHRRGVVRACGNGGATACTPWVYQPLCVTACDGTAPGSGDYQPVGATTLSGRRIALHMSSAGTAWATIDTGRAGDEVWLDRSWDAGASWPGGSSLGRTSIGGGTSTRTNAYNTTDVVGRMSGGSVRACGRAVESSSGSCTAWARPSSTRDTAAADALMYSYDPYTAWWPSSWWNSAVAVHTVADYMRRDGDTRYRWVLDQTYTVNRAAFPAGVRSSDQIDGDFVSRAIDDSAWWGLAWVAAYDATAERRYLDEAVTIAGYVNTFWDPSTCGGGVWWNRERTYKNAVTVGLYIRLTAALHNRLGGDTLWLGRARTGWNWFAASGMINSAGLVNDGLTTGCANNGQTVWTYNQGLAIGAAVELYRATGDPSLVTVARRLADAALSSSLVRAGVLTESCDTDTTTCDDNQKQFKGVFERYLGDLNSVTAGAYATFLRTQSDTIWSADRDTLNRFGARWNGRSPNPTDWRTQASALAALLATP